MRASVATVAPLLIVLVLIAAPVAAEDPVQILAFDDYEESLAPGESVIFEWSVRNVDVIAYNISVIVDVPEGFSAAVSTARITDLAPNRAAAILVNVTAPDEVASAVTAPIELKLVIEDGGAVVFIASASATIDISSVYAKKLVLDLIENPLPEPLDNEWGVFLLNVAIWLGIAVTVQLVLDPLISRLTKKTKTEIDDIILRIVKKPIVILLFLYGAVQSLYALDRHVPAFVIELLLMVYGLASTLIFIYLGYRLFKDVGVQMARNVAKRSSTKLDDILIPIIEKLGLLALAFVGLGMVLGYLNVDLTLFVAGGVVMSMVIAFAAQDTLSNIFAGMFLLADRPFKEGDEIYLGDDLMVVRQIGMRTTRFYRYKDASIVTVPNNGLVNKQIVNFSNKKDPGVYKMTVGVGYGSDAEQVRRIIRSVIMRTPHILKDNPAKKPVVRFKAMADSSINFFVLVWVDERSNRFGVEDFLNSQIYKALNDAGIEIPFPQRSVHLLLEGLEQRAADGQLPPDVAELAQRLKKVMPPPALPGKAAEAKKMAGIAPAPSTGVTTMGQSIGPMGDEPLGADETVGEAYDRIVGPAATVQRTGTLQDAIRALLTTPTTRKVYVLGKRNELVGVITLHSLMTQLSHRLGAREKGMFSFMRFVRDMQTDSLESFMAEPVNVTRNTTILEVARLVVDKNLNDFPVVDDAGLVLGEVNSLLLLEAALALFESDSVKGGGADEDGGDGGE